jgi:hypothetical protein
MRVVTFNFDNLLLWFVNLNYLHVWTHHCQSLFDAISIIKVLINIVGSFTYNNVTYCDTTSCNICTRYKCLNLFPFEVYICYRIQIWLSKFNVKVASMLQEGCNLQGSSLLLVIIESLWSYGHWYKLEHCCLNFRVWILNSGVYSKPLMDITF